MSCRMHGGLGWLGLGLAGCLAAAIAVPGRAAEASGAGAGAGVAADLDLVRRLNEAFVHVAESVTPSVVVVRVRPKSGGDGDFDHSGVMEFLPDDLRKKMKDQIERERSRPRRKLPEGFFPEQGSGMIIREDGYILTNGHVVENAEQIEIRLKDGRRFPAEVKGVDKESDVAVLKVDASGLPKARLGDSTRVRVGEFAIAIGAPFELAYSVTYGHISAKGRRLADDAVMMDQDFLQTDASINPGNSGGPLVNIEGEVIGINTMIRGLNTGIGFAVPMNLAREVCDALIRDGRFTRAWLGVNIAPVDERAGGEGAGASTQQGVVVVRILRDGPSWGSELATDDIIVSVDGEEVRDVGDLKHHVSRKQAGKPLPLEVIRAGKRMAIQVTPGEYAPERLLVARGARTEPTAPSPSPAPPVDREVGEELGLKVVDLDAETAAPLGLDAGQGVLVTEVKADSPAARRQIRSGEAITKLNRRPIRNTKDFDAALRDADLRKGIPVTVLNGAGRRRFEVLKQSTE